MRFDNRISLILLFLIFSCSGLDNNSSSKLLKEYLESKGKDVLGINSLVILDERSCIYCNKKFYEMTLRHKENLTFVVITTGTSIDLSEIRNLKNNVIYDYAESLYDIGIIDCSGIIFLNNGLIDTVIRIENVDKLEGKIEFINQKLKQ